jgi:DnaK suppressor protein
LTKYGNFSLPDSGLFNNSIKNSLNNPAIISATHLLNCRVDKLCAICYNLPMDEKRADQYKEKLEEERLLLLAQIEQHEKPVDFRSDTDHFDEETDEAEEMGNQLAIAQDLKNRLDEIDLALSKLRSGKYGICEKCGKRIGDDILDVDPESRFCKNCKTGE